MTPLLSRPLTILTRSLTEPRPLLKILQILIRETHLGSYRFRYAMGAVVRPHYGYLVYEAAKLAARLDEPRVSILEFGVAGGAGLLALEQHAEQVEKIFPVKIEIYGFDTGVGLPSPEDYRDLPYHWKAGFFEMDLPALKARLKRSTLVIGNVANTLNSFFKTYNPAPIGAVSQDLDFYSSTVTSLGLFESDTRHFLPRGFCYFDDTLGSDVELYNDFTGERLAIHEFNAKHDSVKLCPVYYLRAKPCSPAWHHQMWSLHFFQHPKYLRFISDENQRLPL
jgi:hypothetical protein